MPNNVKSQENALQTMLIYYYQSLLKKGITDPRQYIATELSKMINLTKEQSEYIIDKIDDTTLSANETIDSLIALLLPYKSTQNILSKEDATLMIKSLKKLKNHIE